jgi:hypothetical protein
VTLARGFLVLQPSWLMRIEMELAKNAQQRRPGMIQNEIAFLAENGLGFAAMKLLRGIYERTVVGRYTALNPDQAEASRSRICLRLDLGRLGNALPRRDALR